MTLLLTSDPFCDRPHTPIHFYAFVSIDPCSLAKRLRCRGFTHRYLAVAWGMLGHNLWLIAKMLAQHDEPALAA